MARHPITFSAAMVRALLDGRKTQTRRLAWKDAHGEGPGAQAATRWQSVQVHDLLWVREEWALSAEWAGVTVKQLGRFDDPRDVTEGSRRYRASADSYDEAVQHWRQARHMPIWASRITLEVVSARVERLHAISETDAAAEGLIRLKASGRWVVTRGEQYVGLAEHSAVRRFATLWDSLHGDGAWNANPEVVALSFTVEQRNIETPPPQPTGAA